MAHAPAMQPMSVNLTAVFKKSVMRAVAVVHRAFIMCIAACECECYQGVYKLSPVLLHNFAAHGAHQLRVSPLS